MLVAVLFGSTALVPATALAQQVDQQQAQAQCQELVEFVEQHRQAEDRMGLSLEQAEQIAERGSEVACATALTTARANLRPELERAQMEEGDQQAAQQPDQQLAQQPQDQQLTDEQQAQGGEAQEGHIMVLRSQERQQTGEAGQDPQAEAMQQQEPGQAAQPGQQDATLQAHQRLERAQQQLRQAMEQQAAAQQELEQALHDLRMATGQDQQQLDQQAQQQPAQQQLGQQREQQFQQQDQQALQPDQQAQQQQDQQALQPDQQAERFQQPEQTERQALQMDQQQLAEQETGLQGLDIPVEQLRGAQVIGADGEEIGEVQRVMDHDGELYVLVAAGGFLGLGERDVALPLADMQYRDGRLIMPNLTEEQIQGMQEADIADFRDVGEGPTQAETQIGGQPAQ